MLAVWWSRPSQGSWFLVNLCRECTSSLLSEALVWHLVWHLLTLLSLFARWPIPTFISAAFNTFSVCRLFHSALIQPSILTQCDTSSLCFSLTLQLSPKLKEWSVVWNCTLLFLLFFLQCLVRQQLLSLYPDGAASEKKKAKRQKILWRFEADLKWPKC